MINFKFKTLADYKAYIVGNLTEVNEAPTLPENSYSWNDTYKAFHIHDALSTSQGYICAPNIGPLSPGDVVEISAEVMNISGIKAKLSIDEYLAPNLLTLRSTKTNEFEKLYAKYIIPRTMSINVIIGIFTADIGEFYIRNAEINIITDAEYSLERTPDIRAYNFKYCEDTITVVPGYHIYTCTLEITNTYVKVVHDVPFAYMLNGTSVASFSATSPDKKIMCKTRSEHTGDLIVEFYDMTTGTLIDPTSLYGSGSWFSVIHFGYK